MTTGIRLPITMSVMIATVKTNIMNAMPNMIAQIHTTTVTMMIILIMMMMTANAVVRITNTD
jgi:hypothetical protein